MLTRPDRRRRDGRRVCRAGVAALVIVLAFAASASASVTLLSYPQDLLALTDMARVTWQEHVRCFIAYGPAPGVYSSRTVTEATGELTFVPGDEGFLPGIHFCVVRDVVTGEQSEEFQIVVESPFFPEPTAPANGTAISATTTMLEWDPVDRVPYYHVVVSDHEIDITEEDGEVVLTGADLIWQAITSSTSIQYGSSDPSGHFTSTNGVSPPLMEGFTYNWLVFNNYGNHPLLTSTAGAGLAGFTCDVEADVDAPQLVSPADGVTMAEEVLDFDWQPVAAASGYHLYIHEMREWSGGEASYPVWDGATTGTSMEVHVGEFLPGGEYYWRVMALDAAGRGACSESRRLNYETDTGEAGIVTTDELGEPLPWVFVQTEFTQGGVEVLPIITDERGVYNKVLIPGEYDFLASKEGHVDTLQQATIRVGETTTVRLQLRRSPARVRGAVEDELGRPVFDATVTALGPNSTQTSQSDPDGRFVLALEQGPWALSAAKQGYETSTVVDVALEAGDYLELSAPLTLLGTPGTVSGTVVNSYGNPLANAGVRASSGASVVTVATNAAGGFSMELAPGTWCLRASKSGFQDSETREIELEPGGGLSLDPPISLSAVAASVSGRVTDGANAIVGATVVAVPRSGPVMTTTTNGYGEFVLLPQQTSYALRAYADGYAPSDRHQVSMSGSDAFTGVELQVRPLESVLGGVVIDGDRPVASATVTDGTSETLSLADGSFSLNVESGVHALRAAKTGHFSVAPVVVAADPGQNLSSLRLDVADGACSISGLVVGAGAPVARARLTASSASGGAEAVTDDAGAFEIPVEAGEWTLRASKDGFSESPEESVILADGQDAAGILLAIDDESAQVLGSVADSHGPVRRATVFVLVDGETEPSYRTTTSSSGAFRVRVAPRVAYEIRFRATGRGPVDVSVPPLEPEEQVNKSVFMQRRDGLLRGRVFGVAGPLEGAVVTASWGDEASVLTDRFGDFSIWVDEGLYDVSFESAGHEEATVRDVEVVAGEPVELVVELDGLHARLAGSVVDTTTAQALEGALVTATWPEGGSSCVTGPDGAYTLAGIVPGNVSLSCSAHGYRAESRVVSLGESESAQLQLDLLRLDGVIAGTVRDGEGLGLALAAVRARIGDSVTASTVTDAEGRYVLAGLDPGSVYEVRAGLAGHYAGSENPLTGIATQTTDADFTLLPCSGVIEGSVADAVSGEPVEGALVSARDGGGHFGEDLTNELGLFSIDGLVPVELYAVTASFFGYHDAAADSVAPGEQALTLGLPRNFARVVGTITSESPESLSPDEVEVVTTNTTYGGESRQAVPDPAGTYEIAELRPGTYVATVSADGCLSEPQQVLLTIGEGEVITGLDFRVDRPAVVRVDVGGPPTVAAGASAVFSGDAFASGERLVEAELEWSVSPSEAGSVDRGSGRFTGDAGYIGEATIAAREPRSGAVGTMSVDVYAPVDATTWATYLDSTGMSLEIRPGAVQGARSIYLSHQLVPDGRRYRKGFEVAESSYELKPTGLTFSSGSLPTLSVPAPSRGARLLLWDEDQLAWTRVEHSARSTALEAGIERLGDYAAAIDSGPLGVSDPSATPNPFSPNDGPVTVSYDLSSRDSRMPFVTVRIFNMASRLVRTVIENEPQGKGRASVQWDGLTDDGSLARNGRYVVEIEAEDASGVQSALTTLVLVK